MTYPAGESTAREGLDLAEKFPALFVPKENLVYAGSGFLQIVLSLSTWCTNSMEPTTYLVALGKTSVVLPTDNYLQNPHQTFVAELENGVVPNVRGDGMT